MYSHRPRYRPQLLPFMFEKPIAMSYYVNHQTIHGLCIHKSKKQISYTDWRTQGKKINGNLILLTISLGYLISSRTMVHHAVFKVTMFQAQFHKFGQNRTVRGLVVGGSKLQLIFLFGIAWYRCAKYTVCIKKLKGELQSQNKLVLN